MTNVIQLVRKDGEPRVDSLEIAEKLGVEHRATLQQVRRYLADFQALGRVAFEMRTLRTAGGQQSREVALLNEDQCYLLLTFSRNTERVRQLKVSLVQAFGDCRRNGAASALTYWQQLQQVDAEDMESRARASAGAMAMLERKRAIPQLRARRLSLEEKVVPDLFKLVA